MTYRREELVENTYGISGPMYSLRAGGLEPSASGCADKQGTDATRRSQLSTELNAMLPVSLSWPTLVARVVSRCWPTLVARVASCYN
jgi:hypothetical protein